MIPQVRMIRNSLVVCLFLVLSASCGEKAVFHQYQSIDGSRWAKDKEYLFTFDIKDASVAYDLAFEVRNSNFYRYQNVWIFAREEQPSGTVRRDTTEYILADDYGNWTGTGFSLFLSSFPLATARRFPQAGTYTVGIRHGMRTDALEGIPEIGLKVTVND
ncbi:Gliding motility lipoprotein gldH precursor [Bacteroidales bacterium Barb4]|nr:Gliding motility lipoprotein gldH precursor [Bacteroidales bacterium Barb4]